MRKLSIFVIAALFILPLLLLSCGDPEQKGPVNDPFAFDVSPEELFGDESKSRKPVLDADVDIIWDEYLPIGRKDCDLTWSSGVVIIKGKLYLVGTRALGDIVEGNAEDKKKCELAIYKLSESGGEQVGVFPSRNWERRYPAIATDGEVVYIAGGAYTPPPIKLAIEGEFAYSELSATVGDFDIFDPATGQLIPDGYLPVGKSGSTIVCDDDLVYVFGGFYDITKPGKDLNISFHYYEKDKARWTRLSDLKRPTFRPATCLVGTQFHTFGGRNIRPEIVGRVSLRYDLEVFGWQLREPLPEPREGGFAFHKGGKIYIMGGIEAIGYDEADTLNLKVYEYDAKDDFYASIKTPLPEGSELIAFDGKYFYLVGRNKTYRGRIK